MEDADLYFTIENCNSERPGYLPGPLGEGFHYEAGPPLSSLWGFPSQPLGHQEDRLPPHTLLQAPPSPAYLEVAEDVLEDPDVGVGRGSEAQLGSARDGQDQLEDAVGEQRALFPQEIRHHLEGQCTSSWRPSASEASPSLAVPAPLLSPPGTLLGALVFPKQLIH